jgi:hypothetical protein
MRINTDTPLREPVTTVRVRFTLMGFDQKSGVRQYAFQGTAAGIRTNFTVGVDMALVQTFGIHIQELPLLCRELLEKQVEGVETHALTLTDKEMRAYSDNAAMARDAAVRRKPARKPVNASTGMAWRSPVF